MKLDKTTTIGDVYSHPLGRDIIDKALLQSGRSRLWVINPLTRHIKLSLVDWLLGR